MPIRCDIAFKPLAEAAFLDLDDQVRLHALASHNDLGRYCDAAIYQTDLALRLEAAGLGPVVRDVRVVVAHEDFRKEYGLDCVVRAGVIYDLKAVGALGRGHQLDLLHRLHLVDQPRGVLINFRTSSLEHHYVTTKLTLADRRAVTVSDERWQRLTRNCDAARARMVALVRDWGAFLGVGLYHEALTDYLGGQGAASELREVARAGHVLGTQKVFMLNRHVALRLTAHTASAPRVEAHLRRLLHHTELQALQWINLNHERVEFVTLTH
jgi:GxxExxY protein